MFIALSVPSFSSIARASKIFRRMLVGQGQKFCFKRVKQNDLIFNRLDSFVPRILEQSSLANTKPDDSSQFFASPLPSKAVEGLDMVQSRKLNESISEKSRVKLAEKQSQILSGNSKAIV